MKSGFVVMVGRSNVGKSTLLNTLIGTKVAATSFRAQMTRQSIHGVLNRPEGQAVFIDTPGVFQDRKNPLTAKLTNTVKESLEGVDVIVYVVDPTREIGQEERTVFGMIKHLPQPKILVINKSDLPMSERSHAEEYRDWEDEFTTVIELSALRGSHIEPLRQAVMDLLPEGDELYQEDQLTNVPKEFFVAEIIREKIFSILDKEVPYSITVEVDTMKQKGDTLVIEARILTNEERYKRIIIGSGGSRIKEIGMLARKELEQASNLHIFLDLSVEVDTHWIERL